MSLRQEIDTPLNVIKMIYRCCVNLSTVDLDQKSRTLDMWTLSFSFFSICLSLLTLSAHSLVVIKETQ